MTKVTPRRRILKGLSALPFAASIAPAIQPAPARAQSTTQRKTLRIMRWKNFVPGFETWFNEIFVKQWGEANNTEVIVDNVGLGEINPMAAAEAKAQEGHDMVLLLGARPALEDHVIDHREVFEECQSRYGKAYDFILKSCYNPRTDRYHGFCESYAPTAVTYRKDLWDAVGKSPATWDEVRKGGRAIKLLHEAPVGLSLAPEHNGKHTLRAILTAFGGAVQDASSAPALGSRGTLEAIKFTKALFEEAMTPEVLSFDPPANNRFMLSGSGCLTVDTMSIIRAAQNKQLPVNPDLALATLPAGPAGRRGPIFTSNTYIIWRFAKNLEGAQKFLLDYIGRFEEGFLASGFQNMPSFPGSVPKLGQLIKTDSGPPGRYDVLGQVPDTMTNLGYPGYSNAATDEVQSRGIIATMFASAATGALTPEDALDQAVKAIGPIFDKWRDAGKI